MQKGKIPPQQAEGIKHVRYMLSKQHAPKKELHERIQMKEKEARDRENRRN